MKKLKKFYIILLIILLLGLGYQVYAKYILSKKVNISFNTSDYYFEPELNIKATKTLPVTVDVTVKNYNGTNYTDIDLKYNMRISDGYTLKIEDGVTQRSLEGGKKSEETFKVTIDKTGNQENENIHIYFDINSPYTTTESTKIAYQYVYNYDYTGNYQTFTALATGNYKIECWGAQGGSYETEGGKGAYTSGEIELKENDKLYVYVGQVGDANCTVKFNGGGIAGTKYNAMSGGGASDVRLYITNDGIWSDFNSLKSRIMVAGAGGGSDYYSSVGSNGGYGGELVGGDGSYYEYPGATETYSIAYGGTQTAGGKGGTSNPSVIKDGSFGKRWR